MPVIRKAANIVDWIFGTGSKAKGLNGKLIYAMKVSEKLTFDQYWNDYRFSFKKTVMNGSLVQMYGDNIYHHAEDSTWHQTDSHHAKEDGSINMINLRKDTSGIYSLISNEFFYFGEACIEIPTNITKHICWDRQGFKYVDDEPALELINILYQSYKPGRLGNPFMFSYDFERYDGIS